MNIQDKITEMIWPVFIGPPVEGMENHIISYHVMKDGVYCRKNIYGDKYIFFKTDNIDGLVTGTEDIKPIGDNKIPVILLKKTIDFFKYVCDNFDESLEAFVIYGFNKDTQKYFLWVPEQEVSGASVKTNLSEFRELYPNSYIVGDAHSHADKMGECCC